MSGRRSHDSSKNPFSTFFYLYSLNWRETLSLTQPGNSKATWQFFIYAYQISLLLFCTLSTYCLSIEQYVYNSSCRYMLVYFFFLIPFVHKYIEHIKYQMCICKVAWSQRKMFWMFSMPGYWNEWDNDFVWTARMRTDPL